MERFMFSRILMLLIFSLVLTPPVFAEDRFTDNKDGTVTDHQSGVMWAATDNLGDISWHQAEKMDTFHLSNVPVGSI